MSHLGSNATLNWPLSVAISPDLCTSALNAIIVKDAPAKIIQDTNYTSSSWRIT